MKDDSPNKLWTLYEHLSPQEKKGARKWIQMTHPQENTIKRNCWKFLEKGMNPQEVPPRLYSRNSDPAAAFRKLCTELARDLEDYLISQMVLKDPKQKSILALRLLNQRPKCEKWFHIKYLEINKQQASIVSTQDNSKHDFRYQIQMEYQQYQQKTGDFSTVKTESALLDSLNNRYLYDRFLIELALTVSQRNRTKREATIGESLLQLSSHYQSDPGIELLEQIYRHLLGLSSWPLTRLCQSFQHERLFNWFSPENRKAIFSILNACLSRSIDQDITDERVQAAFDWYIWGFDHELLISAGVLLSTHYKNFFRLAFRLQAFSQVEPYLEDLTPFLPEEDREELSTFQTLMFHFESKLNLPLARRLAMQKYKNPSNELNARIIFLKLLFEQNARREYGEGLASLRKRIAFLTPKLAQRDVQAFSSRWMLLDRLGAVDLQEETSRRDFLDVLDAGPAGLDHQWIRCQLGNGVQP
ncbi:MAG: hypothetical protein AAF587_27735 [Bacteroidota bacterium]